MHHSTRKEQSVVRMVWSLLSSIRIFERWCWGCLLVVGLNLEGCRLQGCLLSFGKSRLRQLCIFLACPSLMWGCSQLIQCNLIWAPDLFEFPIWQWSRCFWGQGWTYRNKAQNLYQEHWLSSSASPIPRSEVVHTFHQLISANSRWFQMRVALRMARWVFFRPNLFHCLQLILHQ